MEIKKIYKNGNQYFLVLLFLFIILAPTIQTIYPFVSYGDLVRDFNEKREIAEFPELEIDSVGSLPLKLNDYVNDNFEFRKWLIAWNNFIKVKILKVSPLPDVTLGKDEWIFLTPEGVVENVEGSALFSKEELKNIKTHLEEKMQYLHERGCSFYLAVAPNKSTIYPENLPYYINAQNNSRTDQLFGYLKKNSHVKFIDMRNSLLEEKKNNQLFYKSDSHWNHNGSFAGYKAIMEVLREDYPSLLPYTKSDFNITIDTLKNGGDVAGMLALKNEYRLVDYKYHPKEHIPKVEFQWPKEYQFYTESYKVTTITESADSTLPRLMNFHDSFSGYLLDFVPLHFSKSVFLWTHEFKKEVIEKENPEIVLYTIVERDIHLLGDF